MGCGHKRIGRRDHFAGDAQGLQRGNKRDGAVGEKGQMPKAQVVAKRLFQLLVKRPGVGQYLVFPDLLQIRNELLQRRQIGLGDVDGPLCFHLGSLAWRDRALVKFDHDVLFFRQHAQVGLTTKVVAQLDTFARVP